MAEFREAVAAKVVDDVATRLGYILKKEQKEIILRFVRGQDVLAVLPYGIWEVSLLLYITTRI